MHSNFEIPNHQQPPEFLSMNQAHILDQIHTLPTTQHVFLDQHHFLPPRLSHHYLSAAAPSPYFPAVNFKLGLNEICSGNELQTHCWQQQHDSAIQSHQQLQPFWEPLPSEVSNENSEIVDRQDPLPHFNELEAIYERLGASHTLRDPNQNPTGEDAVRKKRRKRRRRSSSYDEMIRPMADFFGNLARHMTEHEEALNRKFTEMIERLDGERRAREETWRVQQTARFEKEAEARAREKAVARSREAMIVAYLEKLTGQMISLSSTEAEIKDCS